MAVSNKHQALLTKLQKQVERLQRKEEQSRIKLATALKKIRRLSMTCKSNLAGKVRIMKNKLSPAHASTYTKMITDIERQVLRHIQSKGKALANAAANLEKKHFPPTKKKKSAPAKKRKRQN